MSEQVSVADFRVRARAWISEHLARSAPGQPLLQWDDEGVARDRAVQRLLWDSGLAGITVPRAYGGLGLTDAHQQAFREEAAGYRMPEVFGIAFNVVLPTLLAHGSEDLKQRFVPGMLRGDDIWCQLLSEPSSGSDLAGLLTRAERDGDGWRLDGSKVWTTGGHYSEYAVCLARTDPTVPKHAGLTMFVVPMDAPGVTVAPLRLSDGTVDFCEEHLEGVRVPADWVLGEVDDGWRVATTMMTNERRAIGRGWSMAARPGEHEEQGIALTPALLDLARETGRDRDPAVRELVGEQWVLRAVHSQTTRRVVAAMASGEQPSSAAALIKALAAVVELRNGEIDLAVAGSRAAAWPAGSAERWGYHRLSSHDIGGGTTEMQRNAIAERLLGLPRDASPDRELPFDQLRHNTAPGG